MYRIPALDSALPFKVAYETINFGSSRIRSISSSLGYNQFWGNALRHMDSRLRVEAVECPSLRPAAGQRADAVDIGNL